MAEFLNEEHRNKMLCDKCGNNTFHIYPFEIFDGYVNMDDIIIVCSKCNEVIDNEKEI